ncbi:TPA: hypothetical protein QCX35_005445 [Bacillus toyonensis]|uniref:hypothetical protein n=1 Tax=Bacillus TaxID=1386 RepID=UPI0018F40145|nr:MULTISPECIES: hypothetical protein [Bacillus]MBJ8067363.1 hypothetical protein [Bacillus cereus group sp. N15]MCS3599079.1 hypothetical protein [Bacillus sp. JUb91]HDR7449263.1 hypothetical protein [Bacillus toyonensis]
MKILFKLSTLVLAMSFMFSLFASNEAKAEYTKDGQFHAWGSNSFVDVQVTHNLWSNYTGGTKLGALAPQRLENPSEARVLVRTYVGNAYIHYGSWSDLYQNFSIDMNTGTLATFETRNLYNSNGQKVGAVAPQSNIKVIEVAYKNNNTYVGTAWTRFNP